MIALTVAGAQQAPPERRVPPATATLSEIFTSITSVRELRDGRLLITDPRSDRFVAANFEADHVVPIARVGRGPGEYPFPAPVVALAGDSSLMNVASSRRWLLLDGARIVATLPPDAPVVRDGRFLRGADSRGRVLFTEGPPPSAGTTRGRYDARDSLTLILGDRRTGARDTIGRLRRREESFETTVDAAGRVSGGGRVDSPLAVEEQAVLFLDGWVAVVRRDPYRVDWRTAEGRWLRGAPLPFDPVRVDRREREAAVRYAAARFGRAPTDPERYSGWPEFLPPYIEFRTYSVVPLPDGRIAIRRTQRAADPEPRYDVVGRTGRLEARWRVDSDAAIITVGVRGLYVIRTDEDGGQQVSRHPMP